MKRSRSNCLLFLFVLLAVMVGLLVWMVRWEARQARLDQALLLALRDEDDKAVRTALDRGADPYVILFYADEEYQVKTSFWQRLQDLWNERIHGESRTDANGRTALAAAFRQGNMDVFRALLQQGARPDDTSVDNHGMTVLACAAQDGYTDIVKQLLERGADVTVQDKYGGTALSYATEGNHQEIVSLLRKAGAKK